MCALCEQDPFLVGEFFGYHKCCVKSYVDHAKQHGGGDVDNLTKHQQKFLDKNGWIGFMPCPSHAKKLVKRTLKLHNMVSNRVCSAEFPIPFEDVESYEPEYLEWVKEIGK